MNLEHRTFTTNGDGTSTTEGVDLERIEAAVHEILVAIGVMAVCMLVNLYGVRFATMVNNIGVSLELVVTVGATLMVAIVAFSSSANHQPLSVLFTGSL